MIDEQKFVLVFKVLIGGIGNAVNQPFTSKLNSGHRLVSTHLFVRLFDVMTFFIGEKLPNEAPSSVNITLDGSTCLG